MSDSTFVTTRPELLRPARRALRGVVAFFDTFDTAIRVARRYESLNRLSDAELARRGLDRADLARTAWSESF
ncbi:hypothetical protein [Tropicimonas sp. IMCC6043]|uniref:hypothetical protein n=1 Tax=Tropicimonas sp. IMCC6043 TaxID=2510645 RepID=UPI001A91F43B|nr:hypothetical protein [Tropicimonas sp. IMCC6043]